jgi:branched-chain amino acid transport system substrate-binding protein
MKVGIPVSLSGQFRAQGRQALAGLQAWAEDVNQRGGVSISAPRRPLPVAVVYYDDASSPDVVHSVTRRLIVEDRVDLLMGPYASVLSRAAAAVAEQHRYLLWNQGGASDSIYQQGYRWVVGILTPASEYLAGLAQLVREAAPDTEMLAIIRASSGAFPRAVSSGAEDRAVGLGFKTVLLREYDPAITDFSEILDQVEQARPDILLGIGRIQNDLLLSRQIVQRRLSLGAVAVVAAPIQQFQNVLGADAEGFIGPSQWEPSGSYPHDYGPSAQQVLESLRRSNCPLDYPMVQAYAAGLVAQRCVEMAGVLEQQALREAASTLDFSTFYGRFKIDPDTGRQIGRSVVIVQWQQGRKVIIGPAEQRQARLVYPWRKWE